MRSASEASAAAFLVSAVALGNVALQIPIGLYPDRMDRRRPAPRIASSALAGALLIAPASGRALLSAPCCSFGAALTGALYTVGLAHLGARFTGADLASANAAFVLLYNVGLVVGPPGRSAPAWTPARRTASPSPSPPSSPST